MTQTVVARHPTNPSVRRLWFHERIAVTLWFVPTVMVVVALIVSRTVVAVDRDRAARGAPSWLLAADADAAAALSSTVATAMLSFAAVVFSTTLVAIQLAGGQYSPRVVRVFVHSRLTQVTLGVFLATFVFAISGVVEERSGDDEYVPAITIAIVYVTVLLSVFAFIVFVFGMSRLLRVQYLITRITRDARPSLVGTYRPDIVGEPTVDVVPPTMDGARVLHHRGPRVGVVQATDVAGLVRLAERSGGVVELLVEGGEYVGIGTPIARVTGTDGPTVEQITDLILLGPERTLHGDPAFVFRQLSDIAIRALSPAVNDPTTAVQCLDRIDDLLGDIVEGIAPSGWYVDAAGTPRVHCPLPGLDRLVILAYTEIIRYGADSPQVGRRLRASFEALAPRGGPELRPTLQRLRTLLDEAQAEAVPPSFRSIMATDHHALG
jgi:uncharacterized membrane protein